MDQLLAHMEVAAEKDMEANKQGQPAVMKLKMLAEVGWGPSICLFWQRLCARGCACAQMLPHGCKRGPHVACKVALQELAS